MKELALKLTLVAESTLPAIVYSYLVGDRPIVSGILVFLLLQVTSLTTMVLLKSTNIRGYVYSTHEIGSLDRWINLTLHFFSFLSLHVISFMVLYSIKNQFTIEYFLLAASLFVALSYYTKIKFHMSVLSIFLVNVGKNAYIVRGSLKDFNYQGMYRLVEVDKIQLLTKKG